MSSRYQTLTFTKTVSAGSTSQWGITIPYNSVNVAKIKILPSDATGSWEFFIYKDPTYAASSVVYSTVAFTGNLIDPVYSDGASISEKNEGFVCSYEDTAEALQLYVGIKNNSGSSMDFTGTIIVDTAVAHTGSDAVVGVPEGLLARAYASGLTITSGVTASRNASTIYEAEFRAIYITGTLEMPYYDLRTVAEGGTFAHDGTTKLVITGLDATMDGCQYIWDSASAGRWYYAWRLRNTVGWSNWTDGNSTPTRVSQHVDTRTSTTADSGPPCDWDVWIEDGPASNTIVVHATRPKTNSDIINWMAVQILDADSGSWVTLYDGIDVDHMKLDGSTYPYSLNSTGNQITDTDAHGWGSAAAGDLVVLDVRGAGDAFDENYCQWATIRSVGVSTITISGFFRPQAYTNLRLIIIKPPWAWTTGGYGAGMWPTKKEEENTFIGDTETREFVTSPIVIPSGINPQARVWFENNYSRSDCSLTTSSGKAGLPTVRTWTDFNDRRWWVPIYGHTEYATLSFDLDGPLTISAITPRPIKGTPGSLYGVKARFAVVPDLTGVLKLRAKFSNVYIPQYTVPPGHASAATYQGTRIGMFFMHPHGYWFGAINSMLSWGNYRDNSDIHVQTYQVSGQEVLTLPSYALGTADDVTRPAAGYTLELKWGMSSATGTSHNEGFRITTVEYNLNDAGFVALPDAEIGSMGWESAILDGVVPIVGFIETSYNTSWAYLPQYDLPDYYATLEEFEVIQGVIMQNRLLTGIRGNSGAAIPL